jgi:hypothetical protein
MRDKQEYFDKGFKALEQLWRIRNQLQVTTNWKCVANLVESTDFCSFAVNYRKYLRLRMFDIAVAYKNGQQRLLKDKLFHDSLREVDANIQALQNLLYNPPQSGDGMDEVDNVDDTRSSSVVASNTSNESVSSAHDKIAPKQSKGEPERTKRPNEPDNTVSWSLKLSDSFNKTSITIATSTASQHSSQSSSKKKKVKKFKDTHTKKVKRQQTGVPRLGKLVVRKSKQGNQPASSWKPSGAFSIDDNSLKNAKTVSRSLENVPEKVNRENTEPKMFRHFLPKLSVKGSEENLKSAYIARWAKNVSAESTALAQSPDPSPRLKRGVTIHLPQIEKQQRVELKVPPEPPRGPESEKGKFHSCHRRIAPCFHR